MSAGRIACGTGGGPGELEHMAVLGRLVQCALWFLLVVVVFLLLDLYT